MKLYNDSKQLAVKIIPSKSSINRFKLVAYMEKMYGSQSWHNDLATHHSCSTLPLSNFFRLAFSVLKLIFVIRINTYKKINYLMINICKNSHNQGHNSIHLPRVFEFSSKGQYSGTFPYRHLCITDSSHGPWETNIHIKPILL